METIIILTIFTAFFGINGTLGSSSVDCNYNNYDFYAVRIKYRCYVSNNLNISSPESAQIDAVNGAHMSGKSNNDEIYFYAYDKHIAYFPRGLEKFFTNLTGIAIWESQMKEIHQEDLKPYTKLKYLYLIGNNIEVIEDGLFDFQPDIEVIIFDNCKIFYISSTVFDNLSKLTTLYLGDNKCTNKYSKNNRSGVLEVIKNVKSTCISPDYIKLDDKLKNLEKAYQNVNQRNLLTFIKDLENFKDKLVKSNISKSQIFNSRIIMISNIKIAILADIIETISQSQSAQSDQINSKISKIEDNLFELNNRSIIRNPWMIIAIGVIGFTQVIILAVIYMQFIA